MTSSGYSPPPTPPQGPQPYPPSQADTAVEILETTGELKNVSRARRIEGTVTRIQKDGTAHIRTDKGDMTVKIRGRTRPAEGQKIEIDMPAGKPPRRAKIRPAPEQVQKADRRAGKGEQTGAASPRPTADTPVAREARQAPPPETVPARPADGAPPADKATPAAKPEVSARLTDDLSRTLQALRQDAQPLTRPVELQPLDLVRLTPITPAQVETLTLLSPAPDTESVTLPPAIIESTAPLPQSLAPSATGAVPDTPLSVPVPEITTVPVPVSVTLLSQGTIAAETVPAAPQQKAQTAILFMPAFSQAAPPAAEASPQISFVMPVPQGTPSPSASILTAPNTPSAGALAKTPGTALLSPALTVIDSPAGLQPVSSRLVQGPERAFTDMRVLNMTPPPVILSAPGETAPLMQTASLAKTGPQNAAALKSAIPPGRPETVTATVAGKTQQALPLLKLNPMALESTPQYFILQTQAANLIPGMQIEFTPHSQPLSARPDTVTPWQVPLPGGIMTPPWQIFGTFDWPALDQIQQTVQQAAPQIAASLARTMPNPATPQRLPAAALFFIAAVKAGDVQSWLGNKAADILKKAGKGNLLSKLGSDFLGLNKAGSEPVAQDWRALALPLAWQDQIDKAMLYYRHGEDQGQPEGEKQKRTRFIFDLNLSRMGAVQLDGLHQAERLDLIVRTTKPLSAPMRQIMKQSYTTILDDCGMAGLIKFQDDPKSWITIDVKAGEPGAALNI